MSIKNKDAYNSKIIIVLLYFFLFVQTQAIGATFAAMIGAGMLVRSISYEHSPVPKHLAWMLHAGVWDKRVQKHFIASLQLTNTW